MRLERNCLVPWDQSSNEARVGCFTVGVEVEGSRVEGSSAARVERGRFSTGTWWIILV